MDYPDFDLLGDVIPKGFGKRGRNEHTPTKESRRKVNSLLALGWKHEEIAAALLISQPTLRKHYFQELKHGKMVARARMEASLIDAGMAQARDGNVAAIKAMFARLDDQRRREMTPAKPKSKELPLGKKEQAVAAANGVDGVFATRPAPGTLN